MDLELFKNGAKELFKEFNKIENFDHNNSFQKNIFKFL